MHGQLPGIAERIHGNRAANPHARHAITIREMMSLLRLSRVAQSIDARDDLDCAAAGQRLRKHPRHGHTVTAGFIMLHHPPCGREQRLRGVADD